MSSLQGIRESRGITRREVSLALKVTEQTIFNAEKTGTMSVSLLKALADYYGISTDTILDRQEDEL